MVENNFSGLPVLDEGELTGIITKTDLNETHSGTGGVH